MKKYFYLILLTFSFLGLYAAPGDDCSTAILVSSNGCSALGAYDNTGITGTLVPPSCFTGGNNNGMWFKFVASTKIVNVTVNGGTLTQPQIALLDPGASGGCTGPFTELSCNSSATATASINYSNLTIGNTYLIYVDGQNNGVGAFQLCLTSPIAPPNDNPCNPIIVPANNFCSATGAFTNVGASSENLFSSSYPGCWTSTGAYNTVFFQFTAIGAYNAITVSGMNSPQIAIISTANCNGTTWSNNGASNCASSTTSTVTMNANNLTPGQTYLIAVDGKDDNVGAFQLCVNSYVPTSGPPNDVCSNATSICPNVLVSGTTRNATSTNDIDISRWSCNGVLDNPVWFKYVANTPVQPVVFSLNGACSADYLQVEVFKFTGASNPCAAGNNTQYTSIGCDQSISNGTGTLTIPAANMVAGQTYYVLIDNWPGDYCNFSFTVTGIAGADAGADQDVCISQPAFNLNGTPAGGTWAGTGITNTTLGTFNPQTAGYGTHTLFYSYGSCTDQKIINVTGPQVVCSNDVSICGGSTQILGTITELPTNVLKAFTNNTSAAIPDNNTTGVSSVINVSGINPNTVATNPIQKVCVNINHTWDADLDVYLVCPGGTQIELTTDNGGSSANYTNTCFVASGTAITSGSAPFTGNYTPEQPFTNLNACAVNGNWTLKVIDDASGDVGTLLNWSIYFNSQNSINNFTWSPTANMTGSNTLSPTVTPATSTTYTLTATDNSGCVVSDTVRVNLGNSIAGPDQSICLNTSTNFASSGTGNWTPLGTNPAVVNIASASNPTSSVGPFSVAGVYNFVWNAGSCRDTVKITVNTPPTANAGPDKVITCAAPNVVIGTPGVAGVNYTWSPASGLSSTSVAQPTASQAGTYTVTATNATTLCTATDQVVVTSSGTLPTANAGPDVTLTCTTTSIQIGTSAIAGYTYSWSPPGGLSVANIAQPTANAPGTYTVTVTNTANGCTATDAVVVSQNTTPPVANAGPDVTLTCTSPSIQIGTAAVAGNTYSWTPPAGLSLTNIAQPTANAPGTYTVTVTNTANGCKATDAVVVSQNSTPPVANAGADKTLTCATTSVQIGTAAVAGNTYSWNPPAGLSLTNIAQPTANAPGTYTVTVTNTANGCTATDAVVVTQNSTPPVANAGADKTLTCSVTSVQIGTAAVAGNTYSWSPPAGLSLTNIAQPNASAAGTYTVTVTNTANGCTATDAVVISQNTTPPNANAGPDVTLTCTTPSIQIGTAAVAGNTYSWNPSAGLSLANVAQPTANAPGTYTVTVTNTANGCTATDAVVVSRNTTPPTANAGPDVTLNCTVTSIQIGTAAVAGNTYSWNPPAGLSLTNIAQPTASAPGTYTVTVTNTANGCTASDAVVVSQTATPPVANAGPDKTLTCTTTSVQIGTAAVAGNTYSWSPPGGLSLTNVAQPTANAPGTYTVTVTNTANGCSATDAVVISQNTTSPVANAGPDITLTCASPTAQIGTPALPGKTYSWSPTAGLSASNIAQPTVSIAGTFTVTVKDTTNGCTSTDAVVVGFSGTLPPVNAGPDQTLTCTTTSVQIGTAAVAGINYSWSPSTGLSLSNIAQPIALQPGTYTVTATNPLTGCSASDIVTVSQNITPPVADAGVDKTLTCSATSVQVGTAAIAGNTYSWNPPAGLSLTNIAQPTATAPGTYTVTVTNTANGCTASDAVVVSQNTTPPAANAGPDKTLTCSNTSFVIGTAAIAGNTYSWNPPAGLSLANIAQPTANAPGTYTVTVTNTSNGCTASDAVVISQNTTPPVANAGPDVTLTCTTSSTLIGTTAVAGNTYSWNPPAGLSLANIAQPTANAPGTYTVTVTNTSNGCTAADAVVVSQNITPPVANAGADKTLTCSTTSVQIGTTAIAGNTYSWNPPAGLSLTNIAQPTANAPGTYTVTVTNTTNGCTATDAVTLSQNITPPTANAGPDVNLTCTTPSIQIGTTAIAGNTYSWNPPAGLSVANIAQPTANAPGTYTVTVKNTSNGCSSTDAVVVSQNISAPIANAGPDQVITCTTTSVQLGTNAVAGNTYSWIPAGNLSSSNIAQPTTVVPGTYTVTVTNTSNGCKASDVVLITKNVTPPVANAGPDKTLTCTDTSFVIGIPAVAGNTYSWLPVNGLSSSTAAQPAVNVSDTYTLTVTNTANGCTATDVVIISKNTTAPVADAGLDKTITCTESSFVLGSTALSGIKYLWSPPTGLSASNVAQPTVYLPGSYAVTALDPTNGCRTTDSVTVSVNKPYTLINLGNDTTIYQEETIELSAAGTPAGSYIWTPASTLNCSTCAVPTAAPMITTTYTLEFTNADKCISHDTVTVNVIPVIGLFFPTAFSPNKDGVNDSFAALGDSVKSYELFVYNRWGELVFTTKDINAGWDGTYKGTEQPQDSYVYVAHATLYNNKRRDYKGIVTLLR